MINLLFSLPFKSSYSKVTFDYLINMQYIEHLEGSCFLGVLSVRFGDFCLLGFFFGFFGCIFFFLTFYCTLSVEHCQDFVLECKKA